MTKTIYLDEYKKLIKKLKKARLETGLTQIQAANKLNEGQSYISKIEAGDQRIDIIELKRFSELYKKTLNYFIN